MKRGNYLSYCVKCVLIGATGFVVQSCAIPNGVQSCASPVAPACNPDVKGRSVLSYESQKLATERPGLATGQGREISSSVSYSAFERQHKNRAHSVEMVYYNDKEGVAATAGMKKMKTKSRQLSKGGLIEWGVKSGGRYLDTYQSNKKKFVVGVKGREYVLVLKNKCHARLEVVLSVDGLDVLNGQPATLKNRGYILDPNEVLELKGFRTSRSAVAAFKFSSVNQSYTKLLHGKAKNVGVIGMAVFTEKGVSPWKWSPKLVDQRMKASAF